MKTRKINFAGQTYYLLFNGTAMFAFDDAFGGSSAYLEKSGTPGKDAFDAVCTAASILAEQGELARRALGYESAPILERETLLACVTPADILSLRQATLSAILAGYGREVESSDDIDLDLMELEQKKTKS